MAQFTYRVITKEGKEKKGAVEAESKEAAMTQLKSDGNTVLNIQTGSVLNKEINIGRKKKVKSRDFSIFCRQFNSLLEAGVSIVSALDMLSEQTENKTLKMAIMNVRDSVEKGETLAGSMKKEECFPSLLVNMMEAGEQSGNIETSLSRMAEHFEKDTKVKSMLKKAMIYPIIILIVAVVVLVVVVMVVIPNFSAIFADLGSDLPVMTKALLSLSAFLKSYWYVVVIALVAIVFGIKYFKKTTTGKYFFAKLLIKLPVFGKLTIKTACARFSRTLSTMIASGMPMLEAMRITAGTMDNVLFKDALDNATVQVQRGVSLSTPLKKSKLFPPLVTHMIGIGEETGNLEGMLDKTARYYDEEVEIATQQVMALMEPMVILVMAVIVIVVLLAIYGPVLSMYNELGNM